MKTEFSFEEKLELSIVMGRGLVDEWNTSALQLGYLLEIATRELPTWFEGESYLSDVKDLAEAEMFSLQLDNVKNTVKNLWKYDKEEFEKVRKSFYNVLTWHANILDPGWYANVWFQIRVCQLAAHAAVVDFGQWMEETDKGSDQQCLFHLTELKKLEKQVRMMRDLFQKVFNHILEQPDEDEKTEETVEAKTEPTTQTELDDLF